MHSFSTGILKQILILMNFNINENMWYFLGNSKLYMEDILSSQVHYLCWVDYTNNARPGLDPRGLI